MIRQLARTPHQLQINPKQSSPFSSRAVPPNPQGRRAARRAGSTPKVTRAPPMSV
ncbi:hypothetical protein N658DRAFT_496665 [Parathielavia hyrcaniae]|uniref:Uncharacterized protein n=1 Tax=Parathielavia hyrcaniae TaxID=113614 RepID=A0AAN6T1U3_9PEZI|nr:hypothetical protein N658DRAFT_496665 [Parathielavia hyrcaniae]